MGNVRFVNLSLLDAPEDVVLLPVDCVSTKATGIARSFYRRYPSADFCGLRKPPSVPGKAFVLGRAAHLTVQRTFGAPSSPDDTRELRLRWLNEGLGDLARKSRILRIRSIALSDRIPAMSWTQALPVVEEFARKYRHLTVVVYTNTPFYTR